MTMVTEVPTFQLIWAMELPVKVHNHLNARCDVMNGRFDEIAKEYCTSCLEHVHEGICTSWWSLNRYRFVKGAPGRMVNYESE